MYDSIDATPVGPYTVNLEYDDYAENPLENWELAPKLLITHPEYRHLTNFDPGEVGIYGSCYDGWILSREVQGRDEIDERYAQSFDEMIEHVRKEYGAEVLRIKAYIHSGITISASAPEQNSWPDQQWDVSHSFGMILATRDDMLTWHEKNRVTKHMRELTRKSLYATVDELDKYLSGDVWCWTIEDEDGDEIESSCGYVGYDYAKETAIAEARAMLMHSVVKPNTFIGGEGNVRKMRLDDETGSTLSTVRVIRDQTTRPRWKAVVDRADRDDRPVLVSRGKLADCIKAGHEHFLAVVCGEEADWVGITAVHRYEEDDAA